MDPTLVLLTALLGIVDVIEWLVELPVTVFHGYSWLIRWAADGVRSLFDDYGYWVIFFGTLAENTLLIGLLIPGALVLILAGLAAHDGAMSPLVAIPLGAIGTMIGDTISYSLGRFGWTHFGQGQTVRDFEARLREPLRRRGPLFILVYHFAGYTRLFGPAAAGFFKMPYNRWAPADYLGATLWVTFYFGVGYVLGIAGLSLDTSDKWFRVVEWLLLIFVAIMAYTFYKTTMQTILKATEEPPATDAASRERLAQPQVERD